MIFPRMMALSEVAWGTSNPDEYKNFEGRVIQHFKILDRKGIDYSKAIYEVDGKSTSKDGKVFITLLLQISQRISVIQQTDQSLLCNLMYTVSQFR